MDKNKKNKLKSAFSLPEFLIVIAILVILVGLAVPAFKSYQPNLQLSGSARNLVTDFRYAQQLAVAEQVEYGIYFYPLDKVWSGYWYDKRSCFARRNIQPYFKPGDFGQ